MKNRRFAAAGLVAVAAAAILTGCQSSSSTDTTSSSSSSSAASTATPTTPTHIPLPASALENGVTHNCGAVEGQGTLFIKESTLPCMEAKGIINIYLNDPSVPHEGEASVAKLGDWTCSTSIPSVAASDGFALSCTRGADPEIIVIPAKPIDAPAQ